MDKNAKLQVMAKSNISTPDEKLRRISAKMSDFEVDFNQPARMYYRTGQEMIRMANMYEKQGSLREAYSLYLKYMVLFLEKIREHPGWKQLPEEDRKRVAKDIKEIMPKTEKLKLNLLEKLKEEYDQSVALELEKERQKQKAKEEEEQKYLKEQLHQKQVERNRTPRSNEQINSHVITGPLLALDSIVYPDSDNRQSNRSVDEQFLPSAPWINYEDNQYAHTLQENNGARMPMVDRSTKPASLLSASTQSQYGLRNVVVPSQLIERFLTLAHATTIRNIETCGILAGQLDHNQLVITHLIVPNQIATPDSCSTENEEEVFNYQDRNNLITLGWIHTHPSQTAFLSSVDLHTHCSYQLMMPEAIAIVCAPRYKDNSIFSLTPHYGLNFIAKCTKSGFHPHPAEPPLFMVAEHARLESHLDVEVIDMRRP